MLPKLAVGLHFCLLAVNALPQPPDWHMGWFPTQQTLDVGAGKIKHLVDWISSNADYGIQQEYRPYGAPNENENKTVWQVLNDNPEFSKVFKAVNFANKSVVNALNDSSAKLTFFATPDWALEHRGRSELEDNTYGDESYHLASALSDLDALEGDGKHDEDEDKKRRHKIIKAIITSILEYHILPEETDVTSLAEVSTLTTKLKFPWTLGDQPQRIRVQTSLIPPRISLNFYSKVVAPNVRAKNGLIHVVNHPLLPPLTSFRAAYLLPSRFSYFTSAAQRSGLTTGLDLLFHAPKGSDDKTSVEGAGVVTAFLPVNGAFEALPKRLQFFLFSPFGERALKKLLQFHVVPDVALLSDWVYNSTSAVTTSDVVDVISTANFTLPTLLTNHTLEVNIIKYNVSLPFPGPHRPHRTETKVYANGKIVAVADIPTLNGAVHVVDAILDPRGAKGEKVDGHDAWEDWEDWLPQWAERD